MSAPKKSSRGTLECGDLGRKRCVWCHTDSFGGSYRMWGSDQEVRQFGNFGPNSPKLMLLTVI